MQLSLPPVPAYPTSAASNASKSKSNSKGNCNSPAPTADAAAPSDADSFDSFLRPRDHAEKPSTGDATDDDAEKAAAILAALLLMPVATVANPPSLPSSPLNTGSSTVVKSGESADDSGGVPSVLSTCLGQTSSRSFGALSMAGKVVPSSTGPDTTVQVAPQPGVPNPVVSPPAATKGGLPVVGNTVTEVSTAQSTVISSGEPVAAKLTVPDPAADADAALSGIVAPHQEKFAPAQSLTPQDAKILSKAQEKYFLGPIQKALTAVGSNVGISVAKMNAIMSAAAPVAQKSVLPAESAASFVLSGEAAPVATLTIDAPAPVATVRETMAAVISAVEALERRADVQSKSIDLQFHVGGEKLGLRVELRDGTVHTTFRTESSEMNGALAREWHGMVQPAVGRDIRLADPVFNSSPTAAGDSSTLLNQGSPQQREQQKAAPSFASALKQESYDSDDSESAPAISPVSNSSQLLNALA